MIALTLTAMLLVVVYDTVHLSGRAHRIVTAAVESNDQTRAFTYFLRRQFRHVAITTRHASLRFSGNRRSVTCAMRGFRGDPSLHLLRLRAGHAGLVATIRRIDALSGRPAATALRAEVGGGLRGIEFAFYGAAGEEQTPSWHRRWPAGERPPRLVRMRYVEPGRRTRTLYLSVAGADGNQVAHYTGGGQGS